MSRRGAVTALCLLLAGCSSSPAGVPAGTTGPAASSPVASTTAAGSGTVPAPVAGLSASLKLSRMDKANRVLTVRVANDSAQPVTIVSATFGSGYFDGSTSARRAGLLNAGAALALAMPLTAPDCADDARPDPVAHLELLDAAGQPGSLDLVPTDPFDVLTTVHQEDCAGVLLDRIGTLSFADTLQVDTPAGTDKPVATLTLTFTANPDAPADAPVLAVTELERTTLITPSGTLDWRLVGFDSTRPSRTAELQLIPARCDPHAVAEDKRGTYLGTHVSFDGVPAPVIYTPVTKHVRGLIYQYVADYCGW